MTWIFYFFTIELIFIKIRRNIEEKYKKQTKMIEKALFLVDKN